MFLLNYCIVVFKGLRLERNNTRLELANRGLPLFTFTTRRGVYEKLSYSGDVCFSGPRILHPYHSCCIT